MDAGRGCEKIRRRMDAITPAAQRRKATPGLPAWLTHPVAVGGSAAGILDILAAFALAASSGVQPVRVLQAIASGLLGPAAFRGGSPAAALGLALHFVIAFGAAAVYYLASRRLPFLVRQAVPAGLAYGVAVYAVMNLVVLPLSRVNVRAQSPRTMAIMIVIHMVCVGLPIALAIQRLQPARSVRAGSSPAAHRAGR